MSIQGIGKQKQTMPSKWLVVVMDDFSSLSIGAYTTRAEDITVEEFEVVILILVLQILPQVLLLSSFFHGKLPQSCFELLLPPSTALGIIEIATEHFNTAVCAEDVKMMVVIVVLVYFVVELFFHVHFL